MFLNDLIHCGTTDFAINYGFGSAKGSCTSIVWRAKKRIMRNMLSRKMRHLAFRIIFELISLT